MSAEAGPGPSTMASSPIVPTSAKQLRVKKRVVNLVNPADPEEFSRSMSLIESPNNSREDVERQGTEKGRDTTPPVLVNPRLNELAHAHIYSSPNGVKGILRHAGTPGSGNGVRFFPKNKFRVITPNASIMAPSPAKAPPTPASNSFFSQLLAVTMSPMRKSEPEPEPVEEQRQDSWEQPGEEGEVSLVDSAGSRGSYLEEDEDDEEEVHEVSWNGEPEVHSSPLGLPVVPEGNTSKDASYGELELPSAEWQLPEDMSNLLSTRFPREDSYSMADPPSTSTISPPKVAKEETSSFSLGAQTSVAQSQSESALLGRTVTPRRPVEKAEADFWGVETEANQSVVSDEKRDDSNPTIRRQLSPIKSSSPVNASPAKVDILDNIRQSPSFSHTVSPNPAGQAQYTSSIFADMSAEQAELTWPLTRRPAEDDTCSTFQSPSRLVSPEPPSPGVTVATPKANAGDVTEFYDCTAMMAVLSPSPSSSTSTTTKRSSPIAEILVQPTRDLFEAQAAHTSALSAELQLYRSLAEKLQLEVSERDEVLGKLNMRALEAEVLQTQVQDLRQQLLTATAKAEQHAGLAGALHSPTPMLRARSASPSSSDQAMQAQAEARDLEIRLAKALADGAATARQLEEINGAKKKLAGELQEVRAELMSMEDRDKSRMVRERGREDEDVAEDQRRELEDLQRRVEEMEGLEDETRGLRQELDEVHQQLEDARGQEDELRHDAQAQEDELHALRAELDSAHRQLDELESQPQTPAQEFDALRSEIAELRAHIDELKQVKAADEEEMEQLMDQVEKLKAGRRKDDDWRVRVAEMERRLEMEGLRREEVEKRCGQEVDARKRLENENRELRKSLQATREQLAHSQNVPIDYHETDSLRAEVNRLRSESASKDLEIINLHRRKAELKEDREMLNIALDSKQQEVELMKRKFGVRGVAGSTPLGTSHQANLGVSTATTDYITPKAYPSTRRRSSLALQTPMPGKRASLETPLPMAGANRHGVPLHPSTRVTSRVLRREGDENREPVTASTVGSLRRREREMALA
ncbi:hypothetical protein IAT38_002138 [Cryptococcus sp. DSM 104549]